MEPREGPPLTHQTTLDVTRYARLWRVTWWTQHVAWPLATFGAVVIFFAIMWQAFGQLEEWHEHISYNVSRQTHSTDAERQFLLALADAIFRLARESIGPGLPWVITLAAAFLFELFVYLRACGRFRLPLLTWSLVGLIITITVGTIGMFYGASAFQEGGGATPNAVDAQTLYCQTIFTFGLLIGVVSLLLIAFRGIAVLLLWRHRLRPKLPRTQRMTRSLGFNLTIPQLAWPRPSVAGFAMHAGILLVLGTLACLFWEWILHAFIYGSIDLFLLVFNTPVQLITILVNVLTGAPVDLSKPWETFLASLDDFARLLFLIGVLLVARALWRVGRRLNLRHRNEIILRDKPPVLLLRSFTDDVAGIPPNMLIPRLVRRRKRLEELIGEQLTRTGPFVAIGKPGERLPQLGASRLYVGDDEWQEVVQSYIVQSDLIVMIAGNTHWVQWELAEVLRQDRIEKLLIVFPRITEADRDERWQNLKSAFQDTSWSAPIERVDIARTLALFVTGEHGIVVIKSRKAHESDYETALRVATYLMRQTPAPD